VTAVGGRGRDTRVIGSGPRAGVEFAVTVPTSVSALLEFAAGGSAQVLFSFDSAVRRTTLEVTGTLGSLVLPDPNRFDGSAFLHVPDAEEPVELPAEGHLATRGTGVLELARAIRSGEPERASGDIAYHVLDVMLAIEESLAARHTVEVESAISVPPPLPAAWDPYARTL
jgi:predicted dehydrogenase